MSFVTDASDDNGDGDTQAKPVAGLKTHHNLSIVYIDHELDKPIAESTEDEAGNDTSRPNLTVVYIDHHVDGRVPFDNSQDFDGSNLLVNQGAVIQNQKGLFCLPPELRIMIWELILPGKRLLRARAWYGRVGTDCDGPSRIRGSQSRWRFRVSDCPASYNQYGEALQLRIPNILRICRESRDVALRHGSFIFDRYEESRETGTWWNPDRDVLGFDRSWNIGSHPWALEELNGLELVKHVAIDEVHAWGFFYETGYNGKDPIDIPRELREPLVVVLGFRKFKHNKHYILEFFPHFQQLTIEFPTVYTKMYQEWLFSPLESSGDSAPEEDAYSVTFRPGSDIETAVKELKKFRELCMKSKVTEPEDDLSWELTEGPVYSVQDDDIDIEELDHWLGVGFDMCQADNQLSI